MQEAAAGAGPDAAARWAGRVVAPLLRGLDPHSWDRTQVPPDADVLALG